jgi:hypothetical protein
VSSITFDAVFVRERTPRSSPGPGSVLVLIEGEEVWLPKSECDFEPDWRDLEEGDDCEVEIPGWLARKEGLI